MIVKMMENLSKVGTGLRRWEVKLSVARSKYFTWWYTKTPMGKFDYAVYRSMGMEHTLDRMMEES